eukprot:666360-Rhodomonas_salina.1
MGAKPGYKTPLWPYALATRCPVLTGSGYNVKTGCKSEKYLEMYRFVGKLMGVRSPATLLRTLRYPLCLSAILLRSLRYPLKFSPLWSYVVSVAIRTESAIELDLPSLVWKPMVGEVCAPSTLDPRP